MRPCQPLRDHRLAATALTLAAVLAVAGVLAVSATAAGVGGVDAGILEQGAGGGDAAAASSARAANLTCQPSAERPDPEEDKLGWEQGCWYDEAIAVTPEDGFNETEVQRLSVRTMARIERVRQLEFESPVDVKVVRRSTLGDGSNRTVPRERRVRKNVRLEATFVVNESADAVRDRGGGVARFAAFYAPWNERIVIITKGNSTDRVHEFLLAHELTHALQDDHFDGERPDYRDARQAKRSLSEGEANYVTQEYRKRCRGKWGDCVAPDRKRGGNRDRSRVCEREDPRFNRGRFVLNRLVYSDGPTFVEHRYEEGGWAAIDAAHASPPVSSEQIIHPEKYPDERPRNVTLEDRSGDGWNVVPHPRRRNPPALSLGEDAMFTMLWHQWFATDHRVEVIPCEHPFEVDNPRTMFNYSHPLSAGVDGDRLLPYVRPGSNDTEATGYVWKTAWDTREDAREFADAYRKALRGHDAESVDDRADTFRVPESSGYGDAFYVGVRGTVVLIVNAPTVEALSELRPDAAPDEETIPSPETTGAGGGGSEESAGEAAGGTADGDTVNSDDGDEGEDRQDGDTTGTSGPGFGPFAALVALAVTGLVRRRRD
jgi:PGF-CTERM protein